MAQSDISRVIQVNRRQTGNDLLKKLTRCPFTFADIEPDFVIGRTSCALYLSIRWHALHPNYIYERINRLGDKYELRILLVVIDHIEHKSYLKEISKLCIRSNMTLMLCWTVDDAAMYLERYKLLEDKPADSIMEKPTSHDYEDALDQYMVDAIAEAKSLNRTDASSIVGIFDSFERIIKASPEDLTLCPGVGLAKAQRLHELLHRKMIKGSFTPTKDHKSSSSQQTASSSQRVVADEELNEQDSSTNSPIQLEEA